jgi:hypothetical protein
LQQRGDGLAHGLVVIEHEDEPDFGRASKQVITLARSPAAFDSNRQSRARR